MVNIGLSPLYLYRAAYIYIYGSEKLIIMQLSSLDFFSPEEEKLKFDCRSGPQIGLWIGPRAGSRLGLDMGLGLGLALGP